MKAKILENLHELSNLVTPTLEKEGWEYIDADDELVPMSDFIKKYSMHHDSIEIDRIKFEYTSKHKKVAGRFIMGDITLRSEMEKLLNNEYDYIVCIDYLIWKELDLSNKVIQLDKLLCGIDIGTLESPVLKKKSTDSREYVDNLTFFGLEDVLNSSETVHICASRIVSEEAENKKNSKGNKKGKKSQDSE